jgi:serine/threonine protein kinase
VPKLDDTGKTIVLVGIALGMKFIHSHGVIHRDLKLANMLLDERTTQRSVTSEAAGSAT